MKTKAERKREAYEDYAIIRDIAYAKAMEEYSKAIKIPFEKYQSKIKEIDGDDVNEYDI